MSALGQKRTSHQVRVMSALPPKADIAELELPFSFAKLAGESPIRARPTRRPGSWPCALASSGSQFASDKVFLA
jgi:hypothetical protein